MRYKLSWWVCGFRSIGPEENFILNHLHWSFGLTMYKVEDLLDTGSDNRGALGLRVYLYHFLCNSESQVHK